MSSLVDRILHRIVSLPKLVKKYPEVFDFSKLTVYDKIELLKQDFKFYSQYIDLSDITPDEKVAAFIYSPPPNILGLITLEEADYDNLGDSSYVQLLQIDFNKHIRKSRFDKLGANRKRQFIPKEPKWFVDTYGQLPKLTSEMLYVMSRDNPGFVDQYVTDFTGLSTYGYFWETMIKWNKKYIPIFLANTRTVRTKTEVRTVVRQYPSIVKSITSDTFVDSKLSAKEWVMLINQIVSSGRNRKMFDGWAFPDDVAEMIRLDLTAEMLSSKSTMTKRFKTAFDGVFKSEEDTEEDAKEEESLDAEYSEDIEQEKEMAK